MRRDAMLAIVRVPEPEAALVREVVQDRIAQSGAARKRERQLFETRGISAVPRVMFEQCAAHELRALRAIVPRALELLLAEEHSAEKRDPGGENGDASAARDDRQHDRGERDPGEEDVLHEAELSSLAKEHAEEKRRAGVGQRGDETAQKNHGRTICHPERS